MQRLVAHNWRMNMSYAQKIEELVAERDALLKDAERSVAELLRAKEQRDELCRALEIIAVGDATNPMLQAAEELIALGYWMDIPQARAVG